MRPKHVLLLGLMLLVPVLAFVFLYTFGTNRYALPTFLPDHVDSTLVEGKWRRDTVFHQLGDFTLSSQSGRLVSQKDLSNGVYVANFFFATCPGACPRMNSQMARVQEKFRNEPRVKLVSYTVDPEHDSVAVLGRYAEQYGAIAGKWFFLTGDKTALYRLATEEFKLPAPSGAAPGIVHSQNLYLVDRDKRVRGIYDGMKPKDVDRLMTEINVLLYTYDHNQ
ncbi:SCO family protein [Hymenobacter sp. BT186]|uniref:SCO family protein n=1 Tax=Hymenobacter telluris TaxID=2816474 RepID=A0A939EZK5_9BACT|nr:SCO family protein [Hymenobacter telluris]MBO0358763.1 SCO family protein [Hymenobacter telluris]MBW3374789.1 SCO family protein [Hymenobacter norwichensis]